MGVDMSDVLSRLAALRRPKLLVNTARLGLADYHRDRDLKRLMHRTALPAPGAAVSVLLEEEEELDAIRRAGMAGYSPARHIAVLIALLGEARIIARPAEKAIT